MVEVGALANQLPDDGKVLFIDLFPYRAVHDERTDGFALALSVPSAQSTQPVEFIVCQTQGDYVVFLHLFYLFFSE